MTKRRVDYLSYLLRLWRVNGDEDQSEPYEPVWRASLEDPQTGRQQGFGSMEALFDFLVEKTGVPPDFHIADTKISNKER